MKNKLYNENYNIQIKFRNKLIISNEKNAIRIERYLFILNIIGIFIILFINYNILGLILISISILYSLISQFISYLAFSEEIKIVDDLIANLKTPNYKIKENKYNIYIDPITIISILSGIIGLIILLLTL